MTKQDWLVFGALSCATVMVLIAARRAGVLTLQGLRERMGPTGYDFSTSWASTITVVGALLGTLLSSGFLPKATRLLPTETYAALSILFGFLVVLAPFIYRTASRPMDVTTTLGTSETQYQGYVLGFLLATLVTVWAVLGELLTMLLLFDELQQSTGASVLFLVLVVLSILLLGAYVLTSIPSTLRSQRDRESHAASLRAELAGAGIANQTTSLNPPRPSWSVL
jgi:hypothetical protein